MALLSDLIDLEYRYMVENDRFKVGESGFIVTDLVRIRDSLVKCGGGKIDRVSRETGERKVLFHAKCNKSKLCQDCADNEYMKRMRAVEEWFKENKSIVSSCYFVTFTQEKRIEETARQSALRILASWRSFQRIGQKGRNKEYSKILAGFRSLEIEPTMENGVFAGFHSHIHAVVFTSSRLDYRVYDAGIRKEIMKEFGWLPRKEFIEKMKERGGVLDEESASELSKEWRRSGSGNKGVKVELIFNECHNVSTSYSGLQSNISLAKRVRYSLKYSMKDNDFSSLPSGKMFEVLDAMNGMRKNQYLGGIGKYEQEPESDDSDFELGTCDYGVQFKTKFTADCIEEKIIREVFPGDRLKSEEKKRESIAAYRRKRKESLLKLKETFAQRVIDGKRLAEHYYLNCGINVPIPENTSMYSYNEHDYCSDVDEAYNIMKNELKMNRKELENKAKSIMRYYGMNGTVWNEIPLATGVEQCFDSGFLIS
jgi:hypothetical protein